MISRFIEIVVCRQLAPSLWLRYVESVRRRIVCFRDVRFSPLFFHSLRRQTQFSPFARRKYENLIAVSRANDINHDDVCHSHRCGSKRWRCSSACCCCRFRRSPPRHRFESSTRRFRRRSLVVIVRSCDSVARSRPHAVCAVDIGRRRQRRPERRKYLWKKTVRLVNYASTQSRATNNTNHGQHHAPTTDASSPTTSTLTSNVVVAADDVDDAVAAACRAAQPRHRDSRRCVAVCENICIFLS